MALWQGQNPTNVTDFHKKIFWDW